MRKDEPKSKKQPALASYPRVLLCTPLKHIYVLLFQRQTVSAIALYCFTRYTCNTLAEILDPHAPTIGQQAVVEPVLEPFWSR